MRKSSRAQRSLSRLPSGPPGLWQRSLKMPPARPGALTLASPQSPVLVPPARPGTCSRLGLRLLCRAKCRIAQPAAKRPDPCLDHVHRALRRRDLPSGPVTRLGIRWCDPPARSVFRVTVSLSQVSGRKPGQAEAGDKFVNHIA